MKYDINKNYFYNRNNYGQNICQNNGGSLSYNPANQIGSIFGVNKNIESNLNNTCNAPTKNNSNNGMNCNQQCMTTLIINYFLK